MMMRMAGVVLLMLALPGCGALRALPSVTANELSRNISENTANINEAQARATNAIILKNILRARDRWPTSYSTLSGVTSTPQIVFKAGTTLDPLGLGNPPLPFGNSNATISQDNTASASYEVNPFAKDGNGENLYTPMTADLFKAYWDAGFPKDVLLMVFVSSFKIGKKPPVINDIDLYDYEGVDEVGKRFILEAAKLMGMPYCRSFLAANKMPDRVVVNQIEHDRCKDAGSFELRQNTIPLTNKECPVIQGFYSEKLFNQEWGKKKTTMEQVQIFNTLKGGNTHLEVYPVCGKAFESFVLVRDCKSSKKTEDIKFIRAAEGAGEGSKFTCYDKRKSGGGLGISQGGDDEKRASQKNAAASKDNSPPDKISFELRSLDSIIYFLGEYLRHGQNSKDGQSFTFKVLPSNDAQHKDPKCKDAGAAVNLIDVRVKGLWRHTEFDTDKDFAVSAVHAGERYYAAPRATKVKAYGVDEDKVRLCPYDRTGTILAILSQLFTRSQSDAFLKAPDTSVLRTQ